MGKSLEDSPARPPDLGALRIRAYLEYRLAEFDRALALLHEAVANYPDSAACHFDLGFVYCAKGDLPSAGRAFIKAGEIAPGFGQAIYNAGLIAQRRGQRQTAFALLLRACRIQPRMTIKCLGALLRPKAELVLGVGWDIGADSFPDIHDALGFAFAHTGEFTKAAEEYRRAQALQPTAARAAALGNVLLLQGNLEAAQEHLQNALRLDPGMLTARLDLAQALDLAGRLDDAKKHYEGVLDRNPGVLLALINLLRIASQEGRFADSDMLFQQLVKALTSQPLQSVHWKHLTMALYWAVVRPMPIATCRAVSRALDLQLQAVVRRRREKAGPREAKAPASRLRIGYLSQFFRGHPIGHVTSALFAAHDRDRFEIHVFHLSDGKSDPYTAAIAAGTEYFHRLPNNVSAIVDELEAQALDILIYLDGYMTHRLMEAVAMRPAPVQVFWTGHAGGCELSCIDYLIADAKLVPRSEDHLYGAKVVRMPDTFHCTSPHAIAALPTRAQAGLPEAGFVFCAFNNPEKINSEIFAAWMRILSAVEGSVLWLSSSGAPALQRNLRKQAETLGIAGDRVILAPRLPDKADHLARHGLAGLFLDTPGLNAVTTAIDALWSGLPVLTLQGDRFSGRLASTFLQTLDLGDMVCASLANYEDRAIALAKDGAMLQAVRGRLAESRDRSPFFKTDVFCRNLESALEIMSARHKAGKPPMSFDVRAAAGGVYDGPGESEVPSADGTHA